MNVCSYADYAPRALAVVNPDISPGDRLSNATFGLCGELGEIIDVYKKHKFQGHPLDDDKLINELGDVFWYINLGLQTALGSEKAASEWEQTEDLTVRYQRRADTVESSLFSAMYAASQAGSVLNNPELVELAQVEAAVMIWFCLCHVRKLCELENLNVWDILTKNLTKLYARYPDGVFTTERSLNRVN